MRPVISAWVAAQTGSAPASLRSPLGVRETRHQRVALEGPEVAGEGGALQAEHVREGGEGEAAGAGDDAEQGELGGAEPGGGEGAVVHLGDGAGRLPEVEADALGGDVVEGAGGSGGGRWGGGVGVGSVGHIGVYTSNVGGAQAGLGQAEGVVGP